MGADSIGETLGTDGGDTLSSAGDWLSTVGDALSGDLVSLANDGSTLATDAAGIGEDACDGGVGGIGIMTQLIQNALPRGFGQPQYS